jgi:hypothetical protein
MRQFAEINGNWTNADNVCAYCFYHKGMLTEGLIHTHGCLTKNNGERCARMLPFEIRPTTQREKKPTGDEYRRSLKKRKKRK